MIHTSININCKVKNKIEKLSRRYEVHQNTIIRNALCKFARENKKLKTGSAVQYQHSDEDGKFKPFHVVLSVNEYEIFTDLRDFCKLSVSLILALMIDKLYNDISNNKNDDIKMMNNYSSFLYSISLIQNINQKKWIIKWKT